MSVTTHVLDVSVGRPAEGVRVVLEIRHADGRWQRLGEGETDIDGRLSGLLPVDRRLRPGTYRLVFDTGAWFASRRARGFYPEVSVVFEVVDATEAFHVPLLLSPFGYSTYRGS
jgi:5-hydroxyisourate hydrolase